MLARNLKKNRISLSSFVGEALKLITLLQPVLESSLIYLSMNFWLQLRELMGLFLRRLNANFLIYFQDRKIFDGRNFVWVNPPNSDASLACGSKQAFATCDRLETSCMRTLNKSVSHYMENFPHQNDSLTILGHAHLLSTTSNSSKR